MRTNLCFQSSQPSGRLSSEIRVAGIQRRTPIGPASLVESWQLHLGNLRDKFSSFARILFLFFGHLGNWISRFRGDTDDAVMASCLLISSKAPWTRRCRFTLPAWGRRKSDVDIRMQPNGSRQALLASQNNTEVVPHVAFYFANLLTKRWANDCGKTATRILK